MKSLKSNIEILSNLPGLIKGSGLARRIRLTGIFGILAAAFSFMSCQDYFHPEQDLVIKHENMYDVWEEYRSVGLGLYSLQQELFEQIVILGELRADLIDVTENASPDLVDVRNFNIFEGNQYASPFNFFRLIAESNKLIKQLQRDHPEVLDKSAAINNYDRLYGEALCMRAWAYFNAVRIYGKVPYIHESLDGVEEINEYVNSEMSFIDSLDYIYAPDGTIKDSIVNESVVLEKIWLDMETVIDSFTYELENEVKTVGVNHSINNSDVSWYATVWNDFAKHALIGEMYLFDLNYVKALEHFQEIIYTNDYVGSNIRFGLDNKFAMGNWRNIFTSIDPDEHILTLWYNNSFQQTNELQSMFSLFPPNNYMLKPTRKSVESWETIWKNFNVDRASGTEPLDCTKVTNPGIPGDFSRGYGVSYVYVKNGTIMSKETVEKMLDEKLKMNDRNVKRMMTDVDTMVYKYSLGRNSFAHDASFIIYRAADIHLYMAEIYANMNVPGSGAKTTIGIQILNDGRNYSMGGPRGVRGRVGFASGEAYVNIENIIYLHDPYTNEISGWLNLGSDDQGKRRWFGDKVMEERARELAYEGKRFYDLMLMSRIRNDNAYLADRVAEKFEESRREEIRSYLMNSDNWYVPFFE
ncbi:MAG: RagB/SusD family nutrient uptake outer membrane protein [bacterium]